MAERRTAELAVRHLGGAVRGVWNTLHALFLEVMGFLFLAVAVWGGLWLLRAWREFQGSGEEVFKMAMVGAFVALMGGFGVSNFWRARRLSRSRKPG